jgi:hypothetical protein
MKIAANLGVLDEVELIAPCVDHLRSIGVDVIVVTDLGSTDGTADVLHALSADPDIRLIQLARGDDPWGFPERMYEWTISELSVDRVLLLDADEFWLPKSGHLKGTAGLAEADVLTVRRFNVPPVEGRSPLPAIISPDTYDDLYLVVNPVDDAPVRLRSDPSLAWVMTRVVPKVIANPRAVRGLAMGGHEVMPREGIRLRQGEPDDLVIAHVPFSTADRFLRKTKNIEKSFAHFGHRLIAGEAWHWRRWLELVQSGKVNDEFQRQILTREQFEDALLDGTIQSARTWLDGAPRGRFSEAK